MFKTLLQNKSTLSEKSNGAAFLLTKAQKYLAPVEERLNAKIDKRLVKTFYNLFMTISMFRNRAMGLVLSELGAYICGPDHAPAGTKRISNLLRSKKWKASIIDDYFFDRTKDRIKKIAEQKRRPLMSWESGTTYFGSRICQRENA